MPILGRGRAPEAEHVTSATPARGARDTTGRRGKIEVSSRAIATVAGRAVAECYGVVGIAARHPRPGTVELLGPEHYGRGVVARTTNGQITLDVYVVLEYGLRITEIAYNIMRNVRFAVERTLGQPVACVNVNVQDLRVSHDS